MKTRKPTVALQVPCGDGIGWQVLGAPTETIEAYEVEAVAAALGRAEAAAVEGHVVAGYVAYEAAPAFDPALAVKPSHGPPLLWFGVFADAEILPPGTELPRLSDPLDWRPTWSAADHSTAVARIRDYIAAGDTYQVNLTTSLSASFDGDPLALFGTLCQDQGTRHAAFVDGGDWALCSASPELFFALEGDRLRCRPMKGTVARGRTTDEDREKADWLRNSAKNRAENVMIVDMVRNDLGRIARPESVRVTALWQLERYPSLYQLTSTVEAATGAPLSAIFAALFPCASVTGAPKVRAMEIIEEIEAAPRGVYTGAIGSMGPGRCARFNVAIRTVQIDRRLGIASYGTGGGVVWDSVAEEEWRECQTKALVLRPPAPRFDLFETLLWRPGEGYSLLDRHLDRLAASADYFEYMFDLEATRQTLIEVARGLRASDHRVRLDLDAAGRIRVETRPIEIGREPWRVALANTPVSSSDLFLFHKTTHREVYDHHRTAFPDHDDVLLWNENREITESTVANLVVHRRDRYLTPPVESGLLAGTLRADLLARGEIVEERIPVESLGTGDPLFLINSVRGWIPAELDPGSISASR